jgi:acyl-homoserine-lactone acylase
MDLNFLRTVGGKIAKRNISRRPLIISLFLLILISGSCGKKNSSETEILWVNYGVPHIYGRTTADVYYAFGWAQMNNHADLMLRLYAKSRGRAAEYFGKDFLESDRQILLFDLPGLASKCYQQQGAEYRSYLDAFVKGINDYAAAHPDMIGNDVKRILPVTPEDIIAHIIRVIDLEFLASEDIYSVKRLTAPGSNSMAIGPSKSQSGKAMLISNPHLPWGDFFVWFESHLNGPDFNVYGVALVGMPVVTIAFNNNLGWTHTVNTIDASDRYELTLKEDGYLLDGQIHPFDRREVTVKVKQADSSFTEQKLEFKYSVQGPVVAEKGNKAYAIRISGLDNPGMFEQYHRMGKARNLEEFESALRMLQNPMFNVVYADNAGNILYLFNGDVPVRSVGDFAFWHGTIDGTDSKYIWKSIHRYEDLPRVLNPATGFLQNCNDPPWGCTYPPVLHRGKYPAYMSPVGEGWRAQRAVNMVRNDSSISFDELVDYKLNTGLEVADRFLDDLLDAAVKFPDKRVDEAVAVLKAWDRKANADSKGAILYAVWWDQINPSMFLTQWDEHNPVTTPSGLKDKKLAVELLVKAAGIVKDKYGSVDIAAGEVNRFRIGKYDFPANGGPDNYGIFRTMYFVEDKDNKRHAVAGDTYVAVTEFGDHVKSKVLLSYGNATQPGNRHSGDQLQMLSEKKMRNALLEREDILKNLESREVLKTK